MTMLALDREVWRYEYGKLAPELLETRLRDEIPRLTAQRVDLAANRRTIETWNPHGLIAVHARTFEDVVRAVNMGLFRDALRHIRRCDELYAAAETLGRAAKEIDAAAGVWERLHQTVRTGLLRRLPAVASLGQAIDAARQSMNEGRCGQAAEIARLCTRIGMSMLGRGIGSASDRDDLLRRLAALLDLRNATSSYAEPPDGEVPEAVLLLRELLFNDHFALVARLCAELEIELSGRRRFRDFVDRARLNPSLALGTDDELRTAVGTFSWDGAVELYWHESIAQFSTALQRTRERAAAIGDEIAQLLASGE